MHIAKANKPINQSPLLFFQRLFHKQKSIGSVLLPSDADDTSVDDSSIVDIPSETDNGSTNAHEADSTENMQFEDVVL